MLHRICILQIQPKNPALDHADYTALTRQHELDHTDHTDHTDQDYICPERLDHQVGIDDLSDLRDVWNS